MCGMNGQCPCTETHIIIVRLVQQPEKNSNLLECDEEYHRANEDTLICRHGNSRCLFFSANIRSGFTQYPEIC